MVYEPPHQQQQQQFVRWVFQKQPQLQHMGADDLAPLLLEAVKHAYGDAYDGDVATVFALPAAQQLEPSVLSELLLTSARLGGNAMGAIAVLPGVQQLQPSVLADALSALLAQDHSYNSARAGKALRALLALPQAQQLSVGTVQQLLDAAADQLGDARRVVMDCIRSLPQAAGLHCTMSCKQLLQLLQKACKQGPYENCRPRRGYAAPVSESLRLLQEPAAQELTAQDLVGLLEVATKAYKYQTFAALQALPEFQQLGHEELLKLMQTVLDHTYGSSSCMRPYVEHPAAAGVDGKGVIFLINGGLFHGRGNAEDYRALLQLPAAQQVDAAAFERWIESAIKHRTCAPALLQVLLEQPAAQTIDVAGGLWLLTSAIARDNTRERSSGGVFIMILERLPVAAQFTAQEYTGLLCRAIQCNYFGTQGELLAWPAVQAAASGDAELAAMCEAFRQLEHRVYPYPQGNWE